MSAYWLLVFLSLVFSVCGGNGKKAFVLLGATGDNANRPNGVWWGVYEAWCTGLFENDPKVDVHAQISKGSILEDVKSKIVSVLRPFHATLQEHAGWECQIADGDCSPETFVSLLKINIWEGIGRFNSSGQAANMSYLAEYDEIIPYLSIPPFAFSEWVLAMVEHWGGGSKLHAAAEKPFGSGRHSLEDATSLQASLMQAGLPDSNLHLTDHWLSFFMVKHLPRFRKIAESQLGIEWSGKDIEKIVVTEYEERGFGGRGAFIDGLGQVRDMVQSHLLQVLSTLLAEEGSKSISEAKLDILNSLTLKFCDLWQFDGLLESKWLKYHPDFADSTYARVHLNSSLDKWKDVEFLVETGKAMDTNLYTVDVYQRGGEGVLTFDIGKEETGVGDIKVQSWPLKDTSSFSAPLPGFDQEESDASFPFEHEVSAAGDGILLEYSDPSFYFPTAYARIVSTLIKGNYQEAFVTWPECKRSWEILTGSSPTICLDPPPEDVKVYLPAFLCDKTPPAICDQHETVKDKYDKKYSCSGQHDEWYQEVDLYQAKCAAGQQDNTFFF